MAIITSLDLAGYLGINDLQDEPVMIGAAAAACTWVRQTCGRSFEVTTSGSESARVFPPKSSTLLITDDFSSTTNLVVKTDANDDSNYETTLTYTTDYYVEPINGIEDGIEVPYHRIRGLAWVFPDMRWSAKPSVQVTARWGWSAVPDAVVQAALIEGARLFKRRTSPEGIIGGWQDYGVARVTNRADPDACALLNPYIRAETALPLGI